MTSALTLVLAAGVGVCDARASDRDICLVVTAVLLEMDAAVAVLPSSEQAGRPTVCDLPYYYERFVPVSQPAFLPAFRTLRLEALALPTLRDRA